MATYTAQPSPIGTSSNTGVYAPVAAPAPIVSGGGTGNVDAVWNQYWNIGYNNPNTGVNYQDPNANAGYIAGQQEYLKRNPVKTAAPAVNGLVLGTNDNTGDLQNTINSQQDALRNEIGSGYDNYIANLQNLYDSGFTQQKAAQENVVNTQIASAMGNLDSQKTMGMADLQADEGTIQNNQVKTLKDISGNIRNLIYATNNKIGALGGGDSSAAKMASYAITKLGAQQFGDVKSQTATLLGEVAQRRFKLNTMYNDSVQQLDAQKTTKMLEITDWFFNKQMEIKQMQATAGFNKSQDLASLSKMYLNQATTQLQNLQAEQSNRRQLLDAWQFNNSQTVSQLQANLAKTAEYEAQMQQPRAINGNISMGGFNQSTAPFGYGYSNSSDEDLFA